MQEFHVCRQHQRSTEAERLTEHLTTITGGHLRPEGRDESQERFATIAIVNSPK